MPRNTLPELDFERDNALTPLEEMPQADFAQEEFDVIALDEEDLWSF